MSITSHSYKSSHMSPGSTARSSTASHTTTSHTHSHTHSSSSDTSDTSSTSSSSEDENEEYIEIDEMKQRLAQMKRNNRGKGNTKIQATSKLMAKFGNILTPEQRAMKQTADRIEKGLRDVLELHAATELSAICGLLQLQTLQRGKESIELLINYCKDEKETKFTKYSEYKVNRLCNNMWEGKLSLTYLLTYSFTHLFIHPFIHPFTHYSLIIHSLFTHYSLIIHSFTHPFIVHYQLYLP